MVQPTQSVDFQVTTDALGPINYTLTWSNGAPVQSCIYAPDSGTPDACGNTPSPQPVSDSPSAIGTFTVRISLGGGYPATDFTLVVNYPTLATDAFVGNEVRDHATQTAAQMEVRPFGYTLAHLSGTGWRPGLC